MEDVRLDLKTYITNIRPNLVWYDSIGDMIR